MSARNRLGLLLIAGTLAGALALPSVVVAVPSYTAQWGSLGAGDGQFSSPQAVAASGVGTVYVADYANARVQVFGTTGTFENRWSNDGAGTFVAPQGIEVDRLGQVFVADLVKNRVSEFSSSGTFIRAVGTGSGGIGDGQFLGPAGVATDRFGFIYVAEAVGGRVQKFYPNGAFLAKWGTPGTGPGQFGQAGGVAVDAIGNVYVTEYINNRVQKFTSNGAFMTQWGGSGSGDGQFNQPLGIDVGQDGNIYVAEANGSRVQAFRPDGTFLFKFGGAGSGNGQFAMARGIASDGSGIYVSDLGNNRIQKFSLANAKQTVRVGGSDRYAVAVNLASTRWPGFVGIHDVIVVCGEDRANADPLAASGLAGIYDAPVLMTKSGSLPSATKNALVAMKAANGPLAIHVIGGTKSIPNSVFNAIKATNSGGGIERISGADRYDLSANMATRLKQVADSKGIAVPGVLLFNGQNPKAFYDALAAGALSAGGQAPMMALRTSGVPVSVRNVLDGPLAGKPRWVVSSATYVSDAVYASAGASRRFTSSTDRARAALDIADFGMFLRLTTLGSVGVANKLPDALTGGSFLGQQGGLLFYTDYGALPASTLQIRSASKQGTQQGWVFGGTKSVSDAALGQFNSLLNTP